MKYCVELSSKAFRVLSNLVVTEANAMGTPAIGYNVPGLRDSIRDKETGLLCEPKPEAMAAWAVELLQDETLRENLSRNALACAKKFSWDRSAEEFEKYLYYLVKHLM